MSVIKNPWSTGLISKMLPAVLGYLHPVHAGDGILHWEHVKDLCFLNTTQDHLLGVFEAESQYWRVKGDNTH